MEAEQQPICSHAGVDPDPPTPTQRLGVALSTLHLEPLNGLRHPAEEGTCGWFIWGGVELPPDPNFFAPLHVAHLRDRCPSAIKYLALPPGWRFLEAPGQRDTWFDPELLNIQPPRGLTSG